MLPKTSSLTKWGRQLPPSPGSRSRRVSFQPKMNLYRTLATYVVAGGMLLILLAMLFSGDFKALDGRRSVVDLKDEDLEFLLSGLIPPPPQNQAEDADPGTDPLGLGSNNQVRVYEVEPENQPDTPEDTKLTTHGNDADAQSSPETEVSEERRSLSGNQGTKAQGRDEVEAVEVRLRGRKSKDGYTEETGSVMESEDQEERGDAVSAELDYADDGLEESAPRKVLKKKKKKKKKKTKIKKPRAKRIECPITYNETIIPPIPPDLPSPPLFALSYVVTEPAAQGLEHRFAGHQSLEERQDSFSLDKGVVQGQAKTVHCGFVGHPAGTEGTEGKDLFKISDRDKQFLDKCKIGVVSALFGNFDQVHKPQRTRITVTSRKAACFVLFLDRASLEGVHNDSLEVTDADYVGLWRMVLVENLPYQDNRMNGKIPKLLAHRLLPNAQYSVWVDSKLRLNADPLLILDKFLTQPKADFGISQHYHRRCLWEEVARNKFLKKFSAEALDRQLETYEREGMKPFNSTPEADRLLPSNIPEGSFFMRAHNPMSNLFSCLWFNEVDRFSSRDQISFALVYHRMVWSNPGRDMVKINMFRDCDRRAMVKLFHHREEEKQLLMKKQQQMLDTAQ